MPQGYHKADLILITVTLIAGAGWIFTSEALVGFKPLTFMGARFLLAGLVLAMFAVRQLREIEARQFRAALTVGLLFSFAMVLWIEGLYWSQHLGVGAFIFNLGILLAPVMAILFGDHPPRRVWVALPIGFLGLYLLSADSEFHFGVGEYLFIGAAISMALFINVTTRVAASIPPLALTTIQLCTVGVVLLLLASIFEGIAWPGEAEIWGWFAASVLIATSLRFLLQIRAHGMAPASHTAVFLTLEPVWVAFMAAGWFGENMSATQVIGCALIFASVLVTRLHALLSLLLSKAD
jgi:drug/metabolite transporter (DMT)-like permease